MEENNQERKCWVIYRGRLSEEIINLEKFRCELEILNFGSFSKISKTDISVKILMYEIAILEELILSDKVITWEFSESLKKRKIYRDNPFDDLAYSKAAELVFALIKRKKREII
ncbi:MAG: hypothetical protein Q8P11_00505 [bacterium]|nr:hypothetical protein [bacterium]